MSHLESPTIVVGPIAGDAFRVSVEAETVVLKFDLSEISLLDLATEALEALLTHEDELEECSFCGPDGGLQEGETCELEAFAARLRHTLRQRAHKRGA